MKRALKEAQNNVQIMDNQFKPGSEQRIRAARVGGKHQADTSKTGKAREVSNHFNGRWRGSCNTNFMVIFYLSLAIFQHHMEFPLPARVDLRARSCNPSKFTKSNAC